VGGSHFLRLKVGIGRPPDGMEAAEYVLDRFSEAERSEMDNILARAVEVVTVIILEGVDKAISQCQRKATPPSQSP
jgi:PTH1 family peptidyl-tRNA hydrolase